jgi:hypothetical protein
MIDWYRELNAAERRSFWACFGGWALDALDVQIYTFVVPALIALWHITNAQADCWRRALWWFPRSAAGSPACSPIASAARGS